MQSDPKGIAAPDPPGADDAVSEYEWLPSCRLGVISGNAQKVQMISGLPH